MSLKTTFVTGDFDISFRDYSLNQVKELFDISFQNIFFPIIYRPTKVTMLLNNDSCVDHILTNSFINTKSESAIFKSDIANHFSIFLLRKNNFKCNFQ